MPDYKFSVYCVQYLEYNFEVQILPDIEAKHIPSCTPRFSDLPPAPSSHCFVLLKFSFSEKATKICAFFIMVLTFTKVQQVNAKTMRKIAQFFAAFSEKLNFTASSLFYFSQITNKVAVTIVCYAIAMTNTQNWSTFVQKTNLGKSTEMSLIYKIWYFVTKIVLIYCD